MLKKIATAGAIAAAITGAMMAGSPAYAAEAPGGNTNGNAVPWQICGSNTPVVGGLAALGSGSNAGDCRNAYVPGTEAGDTNFNLVPWQICGSNTPVVAVGVPVGSPATAEDCYNASVN